MTDTRRGGLAIIAGNIALLFTMALHPTGQQLVTAGGNFDALALLNALVHTLAIFATPILFLGGIALTRAIENGSRIATSAIVFYALALCAGMCAGVMSGFVAPDMLRRLAGAKDPQMQQLWRALFRFSGVLNQAFARVLVIGAAIAIILWSCAIAGRALRWYGIISNAVIIAGAMAGLPLDVHGYGLVVLLQGGWFVTIGSKMWLGSPPPPATRAAGQTRQRSTDTA